MNSFQSHLIEAAGHGALILTSNKRLARHLRSTFDTAMQASGKTVWPTPQIVSFDGWLSRSLAELGDSWRLLDGFPALRLWEQVIEEDAAGSDLELLQLSATARKAQEASQLLQEYGCSFHGHSITEDQKAFLRWQKSYQEICAEHHWLSRAELPGLIYAAMQEGRLATPSQVLLAGFDQWSPAMRGLQAVIEQKGGDLSDVQPLPLATAEIKRYACSDPRQEIESAARWVRNLLEQGADSIGVVVPDLQARRTRIERVFRDQIDPAATLSLTDDESAFSLSLGTRLADTGPIHAGLEILSAGYRLTIDQISFLLRTPYLGGSQLEADKRATLEVWLRSFRQQSLGLKRLLELAGEENRTPIAAEHFQVMVDGLKDTSRRKPGEWAGNFDSLLQSVGWPGDRSLSSAEYQMVKAWQDKLLPALASLDSVAPPMDRRQAIGLLRRLAGEIEFQLEAPTGPVQVVGLLESAGLAFDHLWVMGMGEDVLPSPPRPNPFLPINLQVQHQMPHADAERELDFACKVVERLKAASSDVVFSYSLHEGDCELRPSPLITDLEMCDPVVSESYDPHSSMHAEAPSLQEITDHCGPPLTAERGEGGTGILKDQALCPFRAFVHYRLRGKELDQAQPGLDAMMRGNLLHRSLENFWNDVRDQQQLLALSEAERQQRIAQHVGQGVEDIFHGQAKPPQALLELEQDRLRGLVEEWLTSVEEGRVPFSVMELEQEHFEQIGPLRIRTIIDRIDRLQDGSRVILDYKTGIVKSDGLIGERLLEPQLPIYAVGDTDAEADGVAFAQVRRGECKMIGVTREEGLLSKVQGAAESKALQELGLDDWPQLLAYWREQLEALADEFVSGEASVKPVSFEKACQFCDLSGLCRIAEAEYQAVVREVAQ